MIAFLQKIGKSLMLPVATLPAAALLQRFGKIDYIKDFHLGNSFGGFINQFVAPFLLAGGEAIFNNLPLIFAIGVAIGLAGDAVAALAAAIAYEVLITVLDKVPLAFKNIVQTNMELDMGVVGGIIAGIISAYVFKRFHKVQLPDWLAFFSGKRAVPIITSLIMIIVAILLGVIWGPIQQSLDTFGRWTVGLGGVGAAIFGIANRLLIPFGLHHIINNIAWFQIGSFRGPTGSEVHGDLARFFAGDKSAGMFMTGFYPIMMFALPAGALAIIHTAKPEKRKVIKSVFFGVALTSFLTGVTEPMEFAFMFAAPVLYIFHAILTGLSGFIVASLGIKLGFGFSAGFLDYLISFQQATKPLLIIPVGLCFGVVYYVLFRFLIIKLNLKTPGREDELQSSNPAASSPKNTIRESAAQVLASIGGADNIGSMDACITRLRLVVKNDKLVDDKRLKELGASGVMRLGQGVVQIIFGMHSERLKDEIDKIL
ncbi:PTS sugar transporter [Paenibacillus psychroresistens]|uniref:PTS sugar transporter n=1 Tax=Paenibacillus psychroresistens TaxID=1778678 RepID=A0A6B8RMA1_9BACL|nr:N-acetylglucosamine-specific PTS transporter subunit IIBC [Paenibacillus psychroresistens]QGQ96884.1 PTS sugar transporter [Paenibacillus psychroresistens]